MLRTFCLNRQRYFELFMCLDFVLECSVILVLDFCDLISILFSFIIVYYQLSFWRFEKGAYPKDLQTCCIVSLDLQFSSNSLYVSQGDTSDANQKGRK